MKGVIQFIATRQSDVCDQEREGLTVHAWLMAHRVIGFRNACMNEKAREIY